MSVVDVTTITNRGDLMPDNIPKCGILAALKKNNFKDFNCRTLPVHARIYIAYDIGYLRDRYIDTPFYITKL